MGFASKIMKTKNPLFHVHAEGGETSEEEIDRASWAKKTAIEGGKELAGGRRTRIGGDVPWHRILDRGSVALALAWHCCGTQEVRRMLNRRWQMTGHRLSIKMPIHGDYEHAGGTGMPNPDGFSPDLRREKATDEGRHAQPG